MQEQITKILRQAIDELNEQMLEDKKVVFGEDTKFIGSNACIDSMGFVTLLSIIEELVEENLGKSIQLVNEKAFSQQHSPFYSIATLTEYIEKLLKEAQ